ncbi:hypothetical protein [Micromonospora sp. NPDC051296]
MITQGQPPFREHAMSMSYVTAVPSWLLSGGCRTERPRGGRPD